MNAGITALWVNRAAGGYHNEMREIAAMLDEGWELVDWHPVVSPSGTEYDTFLLRKPGKPEWNPVIAE